MKVWQIFKFQTFLEVENVGLQVHHTPPVEGSGEQYRPRRISGWKRILGQRTQT